ncbi:MAG: ABC transporter permease subunit [Phycisphaerae bacterium]|nr:ABC transporter permease subunit [Phycisphaerae bacterium]
MAAGNSLLYILFMPIPGSIISLFLAVSMADLKKKQVNTILFIYLLPSFSAGIIVSQFWKWVIRSFAIDVSMRFPGVPFIASTIVMTTLGSMMLLLFMAVRNIDPTLYEAAQLDGASWAQIKFRIVLPNIMKQFSVMLLFSLVGALQIWETIYMLAPFETTASMMFRVIQDGFMFGKYGLAAAECVVMALIIIAITQIKNRIEMRIQ